MDGEYIKNPPYLNTYTFSVQNIMVVVALLMVNQLFSWHSTRKERSV